MLAIYYVTRIRCCYVYIHVHTSVVTGSVGYYLHYLWCFMAISVAWSIQRPITVWLMNKRVFTRAASVPATQPGKWLGRTRVALTSQARPESLQWILPHQEHYLYSFLVPLWPVWTHSYDCYSSGLAIWAGRTTRRSQKLSPIHPPVTRLKASTKTKRPW